MAVKTQAVTATHSTLSLVVSLFGGTRQIEDGEHLPGIDPERVNRKAIQLGSKKLFDPRLLAPGHRLKKRAEAICEAVGVKHPYRRGLVYVIENKHLDDVLARLEEVEAEFWDWVNTQFQDAAYRQAVEAWAEENPDLSEVILKLAPKASEARAAFGWLVGVESIGSTASDAEPERVRRLKKATEEKTVASLGDRLIAEIAAYAAKTRQESVDGKERLTRRVLRPLRHMEAKLRALQLLTPVAVPLADMINRRVTPIEQSKGALTGQEIAEIVSLYTLLSKEDRIKDTIFGLLAAGVTQGGDEEEGLTLDLDDPAEKALSSVAQTTNRQDESAEEDDGDILAVI